MRFFIVILTAILIILFGIIFGSFLKTEKPSPPISVVKKKTVAATPTPAKKNVIVGITASFDEDQSIKRFINVVDKINLYSPSLYSISRSGGLERLKVRHRELFLSTARQNNLAILPLVGDNFDRRRVKLLLNSKEIQREFQNQLITEAKKEYFNGWALDIEALTPQDREPFGEFIGDTSAALHENGLLIKVILFAKTAEESSYPGQAQDYGDIGQYIDYAGLMFYTLHNEHTGPGAQAPLDWYRQSLAYAQSMIDKDKIIVGLTTLGFEWGGSIVNELTFDQTEKRIENYSAAVSYDTAGLSKVARYSKEGTENVIWYEDAETIVEKMRIAGEEFNQYTFAFWRIGAEDVKLWDQISRMPN